MEREEAIFENENNSNLESESNNRQHLASLNERNLERSEDEENERVDTGEGDHCDRAKAAQIRSISTTPFESKVSPHTADSEDIAVERKPKDELSHPFAEEETIPAKDVTISSDSSDDERVTLNETHKSNAFSERSDVEVRGSVEKVENEDGTNATNVAPKPVYTESVDIDQSNDAVIGGEINPALRDKDSENNEEGKEILEEEVLDTDGAKITCIDSKNTNEIETEDSDYDLLPEDIYSKLNRQRKEESKSNGIGGGTSFCDDASCRGEVSKDVSDLEKNVSEKILNQDLTSPHSSEKEQSRNTCEGNKSPDFVAERSDAEMKQESNRDDNLLKASLDNQKKGDWEQKDSPSMKSATLLENSAEEDEMNNFGSKHEGLNDQPATKVNDVDEISRNHQSPRLVFKIPSHQNHNMNDDDEQDRNSGRSGEIHSEENTTDFKEEDKTTVLPEGIYEKENPAIASGESHGIEISTEVDEQVKNRKNLGETCQKENVKDVHEEDINTGKSEEIYSKECITDVDEEGENKEKVEETPQKGNTSVDIEQGKKTELCEGSYQKVDHIDMHEQGKSAEESEEIHRNEKEMDVDDQNAVNTKAVDVDMPDGEEEAGDTRQVENQSPPKIGEIKINEEGNDGRVLNLEESSMEVDQELAPEEDMGETNLSSLAEKLETIGKSEKSTKEVDIDTNAMKEVCNDRPQKHQGDEDVLCLTQSENDMDIDEVNALSEDSHKDNPLTDKETSEVIGKEEDQCRSDERKVKGVVIIDLDKNSGSSKEEKITQVKSAENLEDSEPIILDQPSQETISVDLTSFTPLKALDIYEDNGISSNEQHLLKVSDPDVSTHKSAESKTKEIEGNSSGVPLASQATVTETTETRKEKISLSEPKEAQTPSDNVITKEKTESRQNDDNDVIMMLEIKKEADSDYKVQGTVMEGMKPDVVDMTKLKSEVIVVDDEQDAASSKKPEDEFGSGLGIQIAAVSGQQHQLHANACDGSVLPTGDAGATSAENEKVNSKSQSKSKIQTCIVCQTVTKCKYNIVRNGDTKQLCGDICFKKFRNSPNRYLQKEKAQNSGATSQSLKLPVSKSTSQASQATKVSKPSAVTSSSATAPTASSNASQETPQYKTCHVCQVMNINAPHKFCNWKGLDFCGESCLAKFQATLNNTCSHCNAYIPIDMRASFCLKIGNDMRPFCKQRCYQEFKKNLRMCAYCQKDLLSFATVSAKVGMDSKPKEFCSWSCVKKLEGECDDVQIVSVHMGKSAENGTCSVCKVQGRAVKHSVRFQSKTFNLCSDICLSAFQYTNKINVNKCDSCGMICTSIEAQVHFIQFEGLTKRFCSDQCVNNFRMANRKVVECTWCGAKKTNFDMIERLDEDNRYQLFCSLNCLSLYRVNLQAKSNMAVQCDQCKKVVPAQYHLTMSDASVRNFCSYSCVMTFQSQFTQKALPHRKPQQQIQSPPQAQTSSSHSHGTRSRGRSKNAPQTPTTQASTPSVPVISDVVSLASDGDKNSSPSFQANSSTAASIVQTLQKKGSLFTGDGKERIVVRAPSPTICKNKSVQSRPFTQTKATSCRPHSQSKEVQTESDLLKPVLVPVPVPVYIPTPSVMFTAPAPIPLPIPIPIPVPVFIPTTRKSANGIMKAIKEIVERMPSDPLEAEMLMMAEAVAADGKRPGDSDTDSEQDIGADDYGSRDGTTLNTHGTKGSESSLPRKKEGAGEEDMIQMALRMAEEMSGPIEDLESSVEPSVVKMEPSRQPELDVPGYEKQTDPDYNPTRTGRGRGTKRHSRGRQQPVSTRPKRQKTGQASYAERDVDSSPVIPAPLNDPPPDHNRRLKFTFGVNAWKNWVAGKNAEIEKSRLAGTSRMRCLPTDILKCTMDELNYSLCLFIKEVRKPNGELYSPDSIYYLCLGIQQYMYENGRIDNIFTDLYFQRFTDALHELLKALQPKVNSQGQMLCRIEEEHLWESKQLGAHSPYILLNTLIYFHTKHFILKTASEHMSLSFAQILKHLKRGVPVKSGSGTSSKNVSLRFYCLANKKDPSLASRKNKDGVPVFEVTENFVNPLRCPVKLYEFFLSKCPESIKNRNDIFYPVPERSCVPDSPVWYSTQSLDINTMDKMLTRILLVREIQEAHLHAQAIYI